MKWKLIICLIFALILGLVLSINAYAHGVIVKYTVDIAINISAIYEDGTPMAGAQVTVYAPGEPLTPWLTGVCDEKGCFTFTPDPSKPGIWSVRVRHMGHGAMLYIPIGDDRVGAGGTGYTPLQLAVMAGCVVWGFIGTALFFSKRRGG